MKNTKETKNEIRELTEVSAEELERIEDGRRTELIRPIASEISSGPVSLITDSANDSI